VVKIEAKLGAAFSVDQLHSYVNDLHNHSVGGLLVMLVPRHRVEEAKASASSVFTLTDSSGDGPWQLTARPDCAVAVITWEGLLETLKRVGSEPFAGDLAQFEAMYDVFKGWDIEPLTTDDEVLRWPEREGVFLSLVDRVTRRLTTQGNVMPMGREVDPTPHGYQRRYVSFSSCTVKPCLSVGVRDPFAGAHITPIWLRFHLRTPGFSAIRARIQGSSLSQRGIESGGHIWRAPTAPTP
jgi:hypothetical protein